MTRYDLLYAAALPALLPYLALRRIRKGKYTESAAGMLGRHLPGPAERAPFAGGSLWLHAVSYGEVNAARAVAPGLRALPALNRLPLVVSTITETGQAHARKSFPDAAAVTYFPADYSANARRFQAAFNPSVFVLLETELWPNFLMLAAARGTKCFMLNARLSDRSFPRYRRFRKLLAPAFAALRGIGAQTAQDAERFAALGIADARIEVTGNCKFDLTPKPLTSEEKSDWLDHLGLSPTRHWIVAGSTHPGEEKIVINALLELRSSGVDAGLILCPRHPDRFDEVFRLAEQTGLAATRASAPDIAKNPVIFVLDQMGVLARAYGLGEIAIVAGSFCPVGGHNLLEAAAHHIPVIYGPDMHSQKEIQRLFKMGQAGLQIEPGAIATECHNLITNKLLAAGHAERCINVVIKNQGSAARGIALVERCLI